MRCGRLWMRTAATFVTIDDCDSLGQWPTWNKTGHLVDTSCYMLRRDVALFANTIWYRRFRDEENPDFALCRKLLKDYPRCGTNGRYSVNYRVGSSQEFGASSILHPGQ